MADPQDVDIRAFSYKAIADTLSGKREQRYTQQEADGIANAMYINAVENQTFAAVLDETAEELSKTNAAAHAGISIFRAKLQSALEKAFAPRPAAAEPEQPISQPRTTSRDLHHSQGVEVAQILAGIPDDAKIEG